MATDSDAGQYLRWEKDVAHHDYAAATNYLSIRFGEDRAQEVSKKLQKLPVIRRRANDILRATISTSHCHCRIHEYVQVA